MASRPRRTTRTRKPRNNVRRALTAFLFILSCTTPPPRIGPLGDVPDGAKLTRDATDLLLRFAAYDYGHAGTLGGEKAGVVAADRYAAAVRDGVHSIDAFTAAALASTANATGPVRDHLIPLADGLTDLAKDATAYADGGDPAVFARVLDEVAASWQRLDLLAGILPRDDALAKAIARGRSFAVTATADKQYALTVGPLSSAADADAAAKAIGSVEAVSRSAPFVVRVGTYRDRAAADAAAAALAPKGFPSSRIAEEPRYLFARGPVAPDTELWREPARIIDTVAGSRRLAISPDGGHVATGADDGSLAIFSGDGTLRAVPKFNAGVSALAFSDDGRWLAAGGTTVSTLSVPGGGAFGVPVRLPSAATQVVFVPKARAFAIASKGPTGVAGGGGGLIAGRAPDGFVLGEPFPITTPAAGPALGATDQGELYVATTTAGATDVELLRVGAERFLRGVVRVPGTVRALAMDRDGLRGALLTDQGAFRFGPRDADPARTVTKVSSDAREIAFGPDGTFYVLEATRLAAYDTAGARRWTLPLVDGRRLQIAARVVVLDGADRLLAVAADGTAETLGAGGTVVDLTATPDGKRVGALVDGRRAVLFTLP